MKYISLLFCVFFIGTPVLLSASAIMGADLTWENLGNDSFKVTTTVYRDCNNSSTSVSNRLEIASSCTTTTHLLTTTSATDITPVCDLQCNSCQSSACTFKYGVQKMVMSVIIDVSTHRNNSCCLLTSSWQDCCRSTSVTTGAASQNFYIAAQMNACDTLGTKISWSEDPLLLTCLGRDIKSSSFSVHSSVATDSVVHTFTQPLRSLGNATSWISPYSYDKPTTFLGFPKTTSVFPRGIHLDTSNGSLLLRPMKLEIATMAIKASVYRQGKLFASITRDVAVSITKCPNNNVSVISGINCSTPILTNFELYTCEGAPVSFEVCTSDRDRNDSVKLSYEHYIPEASATIIRKGDRLEGLEFKWQPKASDVQTASHNLLVQSEDNGCIISSRNLEVFRIYVGPSTTIRIDTTMLGCGRVLLEAQELDGVSFDRTEWTLDGNTIGHQKTVPTRSDSLDFTFKKGGKHVLEFRAFSGKNCVHYSTDTLDLNQTFLQLKNVFSPITGCAKDTLYLQQEAEQASGNVTFVWNATDSTTGSLSDYKPIIPDTAAYLRYQVSDNHCVIKDSIWISPIQPNFIEIPKMLEGCYGEQSWTLNPFADARHPEDSVTSFTWYHPINTPMALQDSVITVSDSGYYRLETVDSRGCKYSNYFNSVLRVERFQLPNDTSLCEGDSAQFHASSKEDGTFTWYLGASTFYRRQTFNTAKDSFSFPQVNDQTIKIVYQNTSRSTNCSAIDSFSITALKRPKLNVAAPEEVCMEDTLYLESNTASAEWQVGALDYIGSSLKLWVDPYLYNSSQPILVHLRAIFNNGCYTDSTLRVGVKTSPKAIFSTKDTVFQNTVVSISNGSSNGNHLKYLWTVGEPAFRTSTLFSPLNFRIDSVGTFDMNLLVTDTVNTCFRTYSRNITVIKNVGISTPSLSETLNLYPNPANNVLQVNWEGNESFEWSLSNLKGQLIKSGIEELNNATIGLKDIPEGMYLLRVRNAEQHATRLISVIRI